MVATISKLDENTLVFGSVALTGRNGDIHLNDVVISDAITSQLEQQLNRVSAGESSPSTKPVSESDGIVALVITDKDQKTAQRVFVGKREGNNLTLNGHLNLNKNENPSGSMQILLDKGIKIKLIENTNGVPTDDGLQTLNTLVDSGQLVGKSPPQTYDKRSKSGGPVESVEPVRERLDPRLTQGKGMRRIEIGEQSTGANEQLDPALTRDKYQLPLQSTHRTAFLESLVKEGNVGEGQRMRTFGVSGGENVNFDTTLAPATTPQDSTGPAKSNGKNTP
jgi:hypothetical protein